MNTIFDTLLQLPLFQGLAVEDFTRILEKVKLHFTKQKTGETLAQEATTTSAQGHYSLTEYFEAPYLIEPQSLFGLYTTYSAKYTATAPINSISINKEAVINDLLKYEIFRLNYLNIVSSQLQLLNRSTWGNTPDNVETRISYFIRTHLKRLQGSKSLKIKMEDLATIVNDTRNGVSKALNSMQDKGLLELHRGEIVIPAAEKLFT